MKSDHLFMVYHIIDRIGLQVMAVYKDKVRNSWYVSIYYKDADGNSHRKLKRGFPLQRDAKVWEADFIANLPEWLAAQASDQTDPADQTAVLFDKLVSEYLQHKKATKKEITYRTSESRIRVWITPTFSGKRAKDITPLDVKKWQDGLRTSKNVRGKPLSNGYIGTLHRELSAIFNYGIRFYDLPKNPALIAGNVKGSKKHSLNFWTLDQFNAFINTFDKQYPFYTAFMVLYWTGCRVGELQALTVSDIDLDARSIQINKTFHLIHSQPVITSPKTQMGERTIIINNSLCELLRAYIGRMYEPGPDDRLFTMTPSSYGKQLKSHAAMAGLPQIRVHDLRHSHASLLINMGASPTLIAARLGHEKVSMTLDIYGHLYPSKQEEIADRLEGIF